MNGQQVPLGPNDERDERIERWLDGRSGRFPNPDREAVLRGALERVALEPRRVRRWAFGRPRTKHRSPGDQVILAGSATGPHTTMPARPGGATTMSMPARRLVVLASIMVALAALALLPTLHPGLAPAALPGASPMASPAASQTVYPGLAAAKWFAGSMAVLGPPTGTETQVVMDTGSGTSVVLRRNAIGQAKLYASDPRFSGTLTIKFNDERYGLEDAQSEAPADVGTIWGTHRLTNDDGAWEGSFIGAGTSITPYSQEATVMALYEGMDAYQGLTAIVFFDLGNDSFKGAIVPGNLAPGPAALDLALPSLAPRS